MREVPQALKTVRSWPWALIVLALPASVAVWSGWVGLGSMTGFGEVHPLPGIADSFTLDTAITLPIGVEAYGAYALGVWLSHQRLSTQTRVFACVSAIGALVLGCSGQVAYHLLEVQHAHKVADAAKDAGMTVEQVAKTMPAQAPWWIVTIVACFPVLVLGMGATLAHLTRRDVRRGREVTTGCDLPGHAELRHTCDEVPEPASVALAATVAPDGAEERKGVANGDTPWQDEPASGPLETWYKHAEPEPAGNVPEDASNVSGNVPENAETVSPWGSVDLSHAWPLPHLGDRTERLVAAAATLSSNGCNGVPPVFPEQVNGHEPPSTDEDEPPAGDLEPETVASARETFADELGNGEAISVRQIMARCGCGFPKAKKIKAAIDPE